MIEFLRRAATLLSLALFLLTANTVWASSAVVENLQMPVWVERGNWRAPLAVGAELQVGDVLVTGQRARLQFRLGDGSLVKLGESARFMIESAAPQGKVYNAVLNVVNGAFRFTTGLLAKAKPRNVRIGIAQNATVGIRGTDVWGRGRDDKDIVVLIEGRIEVTGNNGVTLELDKPLQFFQSTRSAPPEPVSNISPTQLGVLALETELEEGRGSGMNGVWKVTIGGFAQRDERLATRRLLRDNGYAAELGEGNTLVIDKLRGEAEANDLVGQIKAQFGLNNVNVGK